MSRSTLALQVGMLARRSVLRTLRQPAMVIPAILFPLILLSINSGGLDSATELPGFPTDSYFQFALALAFVQALFSSNSAGTNVANDIESGFLNRLALTPLRRVALMLGLLAGILALGLIQALTFLGVGWVFGAGFEAGIAGMATIVLLSLLISLRVRLHRRLRGVAGRQRRRRCRGCSAALRRALPVIDVAAARPDRERLVPDGRGLEPSRTCSEGIPLVDDRRLGPRSVALGFACAGGRARRPGRRLLGAADPDGADVSRGGFMSVARAVGWRNVRNWFSNPALLIPSLLFPLFFFTAFAGGLSRVSSVPGFDYDAGYTTFVYGFVLLQAAAFGGVFTAFSIARDFESGFSGA